ncbi:hypothetical protein GDO81_022205 [Engystomops pustulosus]|uniref:Uncharacterized protein n=1 Tax=Engystomops pustulosus TaxID=76066 RepID=A0AAV6ZPI1_ENGPU|nr:hypothetical protein GDO81_022205 [Engystomops pustulosus]
MLRLMRKEHSLPPGAQMATQIVEQREGKKYVKYAKDLYKFVEQPGKSGRLQPTLWKTILDGSKGSLEDKGLLESAQERRRWQ